VDARPVLSLASFSRARDLLFWDAGILQFVIRRDALAALDFSNLFVAIGTS